MGVIIFVIPSAIRIIPPDSETIFIRTPTPNTSKITFQGILEIAFFSSPAPKRTRIAATAKAIKPTLTLNIITVIIIIISPIKDNICFLLNLISLFIFIPRFFSIFQPL